MTSRTMHALGWLAIAHGLAHAVLPLRGLGALTSVTGDWIPVGLYGIATVGYVASGLGLLGLGPAVGVVSPLLALASGLSLAGMLVLGQAALLPGALLSGAWLILAVWRGAVGWPARGPTHGPWWHRVATAMAVALLAYVGAACVLWPWHRVWGSTREELVLALPGDRVDRDPAFEIQHAVSIDAPPEAVWAWLVQLGQDRAGFYSYDWLERAAGVDIHNVFEVRPHWQVRQVGELLPATQAGYLGGIFGGPLGWRIDSVEPGRALVLRNWGAFVLRPTADGRTRFIIRSTITNPRIPVWAAMLNFGVFEVPHFIMERRMMLTIKALAERDARGVRAVVAKR